MLCHHLCDALLHPRECSSDALLTIEATLASYLVQLFSLGLVPAEIITGVVHARFRSLHIADTCVLLLPRKTLFVLWLVCPRVNEWATKGDGLTCSCPR
jgi:hypothetical protein